MAENKYLFEAKKIFFIILGILLIILGICILVLTAISLSENTIQDRNIGFSFGVGAALLGLGLKLIFKGRNLKNE